MNQIILILLLTSHILFAKINTIVSILPQQYILENIGKNKINIISMIKKNVSIHTYEPKISDIKKLSNADIYFSIGIGFEKIWLNKFININKKMKIFDMSIGIKKISMIKNHHKHKDPHIWISTKNIKFLAKNTLNTLIKIDKKNKSFYTKNYNSFINKINKTKKEIKNILEKTSKNKSFLVFHPSWGYFARDNNLIQIPIEIEGKSPKAKDIIKIIKIIKEKNIHTIITSPQTNDNFSKQIASEIDINIIKISALKKDILSNIINLSRIISKK
jgi:zinc transport system substrate-binding protein